MKFSKVRIFQDCYQQNTAESSDIFTTYTFC